jgi:hypothetical protein
MINNNNNNTKRSKNQSPEKLVLNSCIYTVYDDKQTNKVYRH